MTVKCIPEDGKDYMVAMFTKEFRSINELTEFFVCSRRTVVRVLVERGINPQLRKRTVKVKLAPMPSIDEMSGFPSQVTWQEGTVDIQRNINPCWMDTAVLPPRPEPTPYGFKEFTQTQPWWKRVQAALSRVFS